MPRSRLRAIWAHIKSIYFILYCGLVLPFAALTNLEDFGIRDRIAWDDDFILLASLPLVVYGLVWLVREEQKTRSAQKSTQKE